jgi:hypothetical protein
MPNEGSRGVHRNKKSMVVTRGFYLDNYDTVNTFSLSGLFTPCSQAKPLPKKIELI